MIRPLRRRHGWMWLLLTPLMVGVLAAAWTQRPTYPVGESPDPAAGGEVLLSQNQWVEGTAMVTRVLRHDGGLILELAPREALQKPDVLVYWSLNGDLQEGFLLGTLGGEGRQRFVLPAAATTSSGSVLLYSLGHQKEVDRAELHLGATP